MINNIDSLNMTFYGLVELGFHPANLRKSYAVMRSTYSFVIVLGCIAAVVSLLLEMWKSLMLLKELRESQVKVFT